MYFPSLVLSIQTFAASAGTSANNSDFLSSLVTGVKLEPPRRIGIELLSFQKSAGRRGVDKQYWLSLFSSSHPIKIILLKPTLSAILLTYLRSAHCISAEESDT